MEETQKPTPRISRKATSEVLAPLVRQYCQKEQPFKSSPAGSPLQAAQPEVTTAVRSSFRRAHALPWRAEPSGFPLRSRLGALRARSWGSSPLRHSVTAHTVDFALRCFCTDFRDVRADRGAKSSEMHTRGEAGNTQRDDAQSRTETDFVQLEREPYTVLLTHSTATLPFCWLMIWPKGLLRNLGWTMTSPPRTSSTTSAAFSWGGPCPRPGNRWKSSRTSSLRRIHPHRRARVHARNEFDSTRATTQERGEVHKIGARAPGGWCRRQKEERGQKPGKVKFYREVESWRANRSFLRFAGG